MIFFHICFLIFDINALKPSENTKKYQFNAFSSLKNFWKAPKNRSKSCSLKFEFGACVINRNFLEILMQHVWTFRFSNLKFSWILLKFFYENLILTIQVWEVSCLLWRWWGREKSQLLWHGKRRSSQLSS